MQLNNVISGHVGQSPSADRGCALHPPHTSTHNVQQPAPQDVRRSFEPLMPFSLLVAT
ncbi:hypothetical protein L842_6209 [Mycobacterium intracellulare MIN_052511_1280]|nr:hypothetical protein L842_6209 [Mycobacterium intracellulare MIN_052511_1280]